MRVTALGQSSANASGAYELAPLVASWRRSLSARGRSPKTVTIYTSEADAFGRYLAEQGMVSSSHSHRWWLRTFARIQSDGPAVMASVVALSVSIRAS